MRIKTGKGVFVEYSYVQNRIHDEIVDPFLRNTIIALDYLVKHSILTITFEEDSVLKRVDIIDVLVADSVNNITIVQSKKNGYSPKHNTVMFYDTHGIVFRKNHRKIWFQKNKGYNSPLALLSHELIHCYNELYQTEAYYSRKQNFESRGQKIDYDGRDLSFPNAEEVFVIKMTNQVAKHLDEDKRSNYGRSYYPVSSVLSTDKMKNNT